MTGKASRKKDKQVAPPEPTEAQRQYEAHRKSLEQPTAAIEPPAERPHQNNKRSRQREDTIIAWLEKGYTLGLAAEKADINRRTLIEWRQADEDFNKRVEDAIERGTDLLEDEAKRRATDGVDEPVFQQGECVGFKRVYSDTLMTMILGGRRTKYGRTRTEVTGADGGPVQHKIEVEFVAPKASK